MVGRRSSYHVRAFHARPLSASLSTQAGVCRRESRQGSNRTGILCCAQIHLRGSIAPTSGRCWEVARPPSKGSPTTNRPPLQQPVSQQRSGLRPTRSVPSTAPVPSRDPAVGNENGAGGRRELPEVQ